MIDDMIEHRCSKCIFMYTYLHIHIYMYRNTFVHAYMHTHKQTYAYVHGYFHTNIHIHMCINTHTYIYKHASIPIGASRSKTLSSAEISFLRVFFASFMTLKALRKSSSARSPVCVNVCRKYYFLLQRGFSASFIMSTALQKSSSVTYVCECACKSSSARWPMYVNACGQFNDKYGQSQTYNKRFQ